MKQWLYKAGASIAGILFVVSAMSLAAPKTVRAVVSALVTVANTSANPVPNRDVDNSANFPFSGEVCFGDPIVCPGVAGQFAVPAATSSGVPVKRLIIETVSGFCEAAGSGGSSFIAGIALRTSTPTDSSNSSLETVILPAFFTTPGVETFNGAVHFYASPGAGVSAGSVGASPNFEGGCLAAVSGHLVTQ